MTLGLVRQQPCSLKPEQTRLPSTQEARPQPPPQAWVRSNSKEVMEEVTATSLVAMAVAPQRDQMARVETRDPLVVMVVVVVVAPTAGRLEELAPLVLAEPEVMVEEELVVEQEGLESVLMVRQEQRLPAAAAAELQAMCQALTLQQTAVMEHKRLSGR